MLRPLPPASSRIRSAPQRTTGTLASSTSSVATMCSRARYLGTRGLFLPIQVQLNIQPIVNASNALPVYFSAPSQATLNSLTSTLAGLQTAFDNGGFFVPAYANAGFTRSNYGLHAAGQFQLSRMVQPVEPAFFQWPAISGIVHLEPQHRRFDRCAEFDRACAAPADGFSGSSH